LIYLRRLRLVCLRFFTRRFGFLVDFLGFLHFVCFRILPRRFLVRRFLRPPVELPEPDAAGGVEGVGGGVGGGEGGGVGGGFSPSPNNHFSLGPSLVLTSSSSFP